MALVSVLMPVFNAESYLALAIDSMLAQTFGDFELVIIDDGSTDGSWSIVCDFAARDARIRAHWQDNAGVSATRNELLARAACDWVVWMDADDVSLPNRLQLQYEAVQRDSSLVCLGTSAQCIDPLGNDLNLEEYPSTHEEIIEQQSGGGAVRFATTMMRRDVALQVGGFRAPFRMGEDFDLLLRLSEQGRMANLPIALYLYRQHIASACATLGANWSDYCAVILELARERRATGQDRLQRGETVSVASTPAPAGRRMVAAMYWRWSFYANRNENFALARRYALQSALWWPLSISTWRLMLLSVFRAKAVGLEIRW